MEPESRQPRTEGPAESSDDAVNRNGGWTSTGDLASAEPRPILVSDLVSNNDNAPASSKGKRPAADDQDWLPTERRYLSSLPPELIDHVLSYLSPIDLIAVSGTCRDLYRLATMDRFWQPLVQANVPGSVLASPSPYATFRDLYAAHDLRWFLPKHKLWFCDRDLTGKLMLARYDPRTGNIEGYQLLAISRRTTFEHWQLNPDVLIYSFEPSVKLHTDRPVIRFAPTRPWQQEQDGVTITRIPLRNGRQLFSHTFSSARLGRPARSNDIASLSYCVQATNRFRAETCMALDSDYQRLGSREVVRTNFMLARPLSPSAAACRSRLDFPYGDVWPPPAIPAQHRVASANVDVQSSRPPLSDEDLPTCRAEISDRAFRIRRWLDIRRSSLGSWRQDSPIDMDASDGIPRQLREGHTDDRHDVYYETPFVDVQLGEDISTYATLDAQLYTPTALYPYRGIWVGDYSGHGCEFVLINQPERKDDDLYADIIARREDESDDDYAQRKIDETAHRGRLEAIKLTGDPNIPRGEYTFIAPEIGQDGFVTVLQDPPFHAARVVQSVGHVARTGFINDQYVETQLILISHDRLAQYWTEFNHISFFQRVDIDSYLSI